MSVNMRRRRMEKHGRGKLQRRRSPISMRHVPISSTSAMISTKTKVLTGKTLTGARGNLHT